MDLQPLLDALSFDAAGLVPSIAQDAQTGEVLMLAYVNADTLRTTLETGTMTYWSRSRGRAWTKGETSGHTQRVVSVHLDCDGDALLFRVEQKGGAACHTGRRSCFFRRVEGGGLVEEGEPLVDPASLYG